MVRHEYQEGSIRIAVGHDENTGYFISVYDKRLEVNVETHDDFDVLRYDVARDGTGCYLNAHTGSHGFGKQISLGAMEKIWRLYIIDQSAMDLLRENLTSL
ncbi:hypothetical protein N7494_005420 [Penicillium frequentans]|uniref:Uncharacterized protein n=1 Tax=Penicillium frequentans TaxID=3151616 RepID=A0AAD6GHH7_9EURO|nr:hypothetical protein N7494_005420 [Penicillium glabrum]